MRFTDVLLYNHNFCSTFTWGVNNECESKYVAVFFPLLCIDLGKEA